MVFSTGYSEAVENSQVLRIIDHFLTMNRTEAVSRFLVGGYAQCYTCPAGLTCEAGNIVKRHGFVEEMTPEMLPAEFAAQPQAVQKCEETASLSNRICAAWDGRSC